MTSGWLLSIYLVTLAAHFIALAWGLRDSVGSGATVAKH